MIHNERHRNEEERQLPSLQWRMDLEARLTEFLCRAQLKKEREERYAAEAGQ